MLRTLALFLAAGAATAPAGGQVAPAPSGSVQRYGPAFDQLVDKDESVHAGARGITWAEGPAWIADGGFLLLSDPPKNRMYRWKPGTSSLEIFLEPSGATETKGFREPGSNGLKPAGPGLLLVADSGNRAIALLNLRTKAKRLLAQRFEGKKFNSPNDLTVGPDGAIWFTDPPYGLEGINASPLKEQAANRVYRLGPDGKVTAVESELIFPNGIIFSPDGRTLYVSNSDPKRAIILAWDVSPRGTLSRRRVFADMTSLAAKGMPGLPDGMCMDERGDLWAASPGGIHVFSPDGHAIGLVSTGATISNCTFGGADGRTLFMTSTHEVATLRTKVRGAPFRNPKFPSEAKIRKESRAAQ
jgi:gluconolactonase